MSDLTRRELARLIPGAILASCIPSKANAQERRMKLSGVYQVLATQNLGASRAFYERHFGMRAAFVADWYVQLVAPELPLLQLGLIEAGHPSMPSPEQRANGCTIVTLQVEDVDAVFHDLREAQAQLLGEPRDESWGQRHFFAVDPGGFFVDVVTPIEPTREYVGAYVEPSA